jgi:hypothetical protein
VKQKNNPRNFVFLAKQAGMVRLWEREENGVVCEFGAIFPEGVMFERQKNGVIKKNKKKQENSQNWKSFLDMGVLRFTFG